MFVSSPPPPSVRVTFYKALTHPLACRLTDGYPNCNDCLRISPGVSRILAQITRNFYKLYCKASINLKQLEYHWSPLTFKIWIFIISDNQQECWVSKQVHNADHCWVIFGGEMLFNRVEILSVLPANAGTKTTGEEIHLFLFKGTCFTCSSSESEVWILNSLNMNAVLRILFIFHWFSFFFLCVAFCYIINKFFHWFKSEIFMKSDLKNM